MLTIHELCKQAVGSLATDILDRQGLGDEFDALDDETVAELRDTWAELIERSLQPVLDDAALGEAVRHMAERFIIWKDGQFRGWLKYGEHFVAETVGVALQNEKQAEHVKDGS